MVLLGVKAMDMEVTRHWAIRVDTTATQPWCCGVIRVGMRATQHWCR